MKTIKEKPHHILLGESGQERLDNFRDKFKKDPIKARVHYFSSSNGGQIAKDRQVLFIHKNGDYQVVNYVVRIYISTSNKLFQREKKLQSISYSKGKFYYITGGPNKSVKQATFGLFMSVINHYPKSRDIFIEAVNKITWHGWVNTLAESKYVMGISLNTMIKNKLFSQAKIMKYQFKLPEPTVIMLLRSLKYDYYDGLKCWKVIKPYLSNINKMKEELLSSPLFSDTVTMAKSLHRKVNCMWSVKRLKIEHDAWAKEITMALIETEDIRQLNIGRRFLNFCEFTGVEPLKTNVDLMIEGRTQSHCVATYISKVDNGQSCIIHVEGYTLELRGLSGNSDPKDVKLKISQFKGFSNKAAPTELINRVQRYLDKYNETVMISSLDDDFNNNTNFPPVERVADLGYNQQLMTLFPNRVLEMNDNPF